jgi:hypothetical protein
LLPLAVLTVLAGCAVTSADGQRLRPGSSEFRAYVEQVFREQNQVASDLAFALEAASAGVPPEDLAAAEDALLMACAGLNELAALRRDEQRLGPRRGLKAARTAADCEIAARSARAALDASNDPTRG